MLALLAGAGGAGAQDKDKAPEKAAAEAKAEPAKADAKKEAVKPEERKEEAKPAPAPNKGDVAWMLTSTALVLMMRVPALALFYGGMVRAKNMLSVLMQVFVVFPLVTVLWCIYDYSLAFTEGNAFIGGFDRLFMKGIFHANAGTFLNAATFSKGVVIPELLFATFQATFAAITLALISPTKRAANSVPAESSPRSGFPTPKITALLLTNLRRRSSNTLIYAV